MRRASRGEVNAILQAPGDVDAIRNRCGGATEDPVRVERLKSANNEEGPGISVHLCPDVRTNIQTARRREDHAALYSALKGALERIRVLFGKHETAAPLRSVIEQRPQLLSTR